MSIEDPKPPLAQAEEPKPVHRAPHKPAHKAEHKAAPTPKPQEKKPDSSRQDDVLEGQVVSETVTPKTRAPALKSKPDAFSGGAGEVLTSEPAHSEFSSQLQEFFQELNLSKKHALCGLGCLAMVIVLVWGSIWAVRYYKSHGLPSISSLWSKTVTDTAKTVTDASKKVAGQVTEKVTDAVKTISGEVTSQDGTGIGTTSLVGQGGFVTPREIRDPGIYATIAIGMEDQDKAGISYYVDVFRRLQNAYGTNVHELLNKSTDRRARLEAYLNLMHNLYNEGIKVQKEINDRMLLMQNQYTRAQADLDILDKQFFDQLGIYDGQGSEETLTRFTQTNEKITGIRSQFKAMQKVRSLFDVGLPKVDKRIRDLELNREPLISGIKVYDVQGSDLELIVPIATDTEDSAESDSLTSSPIATGIGGGILPNPADVTAGHDYISQPGGGFTVKPTTQSTPKIVPK